MPMYDMDCPACGFLPDEFAKVSEREVCPHCGEKVSLRVTMFHTAGIIWSNQEESTQLGKTFETNAQKRAWLKENPNVRQFSKGDSYDREHKEWVAEECQKVAKKAGYSDLKSMQKARKQEVAEKGNPRNLDKAAPA